MSTPGERITSFFPKVLTLSGDYVGEPFELLDWSKDWLKELYSQDEDGEFRYSSASLEVPRKNAKSQMCAGIAMAEICNVIRPGHLEILVAASTRDQASIILKKCKLMVENSAMLDGLIEVQRNVLINRKTGSTITVISKEAGGAHGSEPSLVIMDELHTWKGTDLYDALTTGRGTRKSSLWIAITTATHADTTLWGTLRAKFIRGRHMFNGKWVDGKKSRHFYCGYGPEEGEEYDPADYEAFKRHNPSWRIINKQAFEDMVDECASEASVRRLLHNERISDDLAWLPYGLWPSVGTANKIKAGRRVVLGADASRSGDCSGIVAIDIETFETNTLGVWESTHDDWVVPLDEVENTFAEAIEKYDVVEVAYDPYYLEATIIRLDSKFPRTVFNAFNTNAPGKLSTAAATTYHKIQDRKLSHDGHPSLVEHGNSVMGIQTRKGMKLGKLDSRKIDLMIAVVIACDRASHYAAKGAPPKRNYSRTPVSLSW